MSAERHMSGDFPLKVFLDVKFDDNKRANGALPDLFSAHYMVSRQNEHHVIYVHTKSNLFPAPIFTIHIITQFLLTSPARKFSQTS